MEGGLTSTQEGSWQLLSGKMPVLLILIEGRGSRVVESRRGKRR